MSAKDKEVEDHSIKNNPSKKKRNLIFIGDVYRVLHHKDKDGTPYTTNPLVDTIEQLIDKNGDIFNIYVQSRYKMDQRRISSVAVKKAIIEVFVGDTPYALQDMQEAHPEMFKTCDLFMTVDAGIKSNVKAMGPDGKPVYLSGKAWFDMFCEGINLNAIKLEIEDKFSIPAAAPVNLDVTADDKGDSGKSDGDKNPPKK